MFDFIEKILMFIKDIVSALGYWGIGGGMFFESACVPVPSELVLPLGGAMVLDGRVTMLGVNVAAAAGSMLGSLLAYIVGFYGGRSFILRYGKYFFVSHEHFFKAESTFNKYGNAAVFFGRLLPVIRTFISLPAGIARMNIRKFLAFSLLGMIPWNALLIYLGFKFGQQYETVIRPIFKKFEYLVIVLLVLAVIVLIVRSILKKRKGQEAE